MEPLDEPIASGDADARITHWQDSLRKAVAHIDDHLDQALTNEEIARAAGMSQTHFCRVFKTLTGEKVGEYARRRRLERAAAALRLTQYPVTQIALEYGFESPSAFTRSFRRQFGMTPNRLRNRHVAPPLAEKLKISPPPKPSRLVSVEELPTRTVVYRSVVGGGYPKLLAVIGRLFHWSKKSGNASDSITLMIRSFDDDAVTPDERARYDVGVLVDGMVSDPGSFSLGKISAGLYARSRFEGDLAKHAAAWNELAYHWTFHAGYDFSALEGYDLISLETDSVAGLLRSFGSMARNEWRYETEMLMPVRPGRVSILGR